MRKTAMTFLFVLLISIQIFAQDSSAPVITEIVPQEAKVKDKITIRGNNFHNEKEKNKVLFGTMMAEVVEASKDTLVIIVPDIKKACGVSVEVMEKKSNEIAFRVLPYLEFVLPEKNIFAGKKILGIVRVKGSTKPWKIRVMNKYYEVVDLVGGNEQIIVTSGGEDNKAELQIIAKQKGNFSLSCKKLEELDTASGETAKINKSSAVSLEPTTEESEGSKEKISATVSADAIANDAENKEKTPAANEDKNKPLDNKLADESKSTVNPEEAKDSKEKPLVTHEEENKDATIVEKTSEIDMTEKSSPGEKDKESAAVKDKESAAAKDKTTTLTAKDKKKDEATVEKGKGKNNAAKEEKTVSAKDSKDKTTVTPSSTKTGDKNEVLAYCNKLKEKINQKKSELLKLQSQIEAKLVEYGRSKAGETSKKQDKIGDIDSRGKKILQRIEQIESEMGELKKDPEKNKTMIEKLRKERSKLYEERKNIKAWKQTLSSGSSKTVSSVKEQIGTLTEKREKLQKEIDTLQKEYEDKLKSLII